jgi:hypothetical protein
MGSSFNTLLLALFFRSMNQTDHVYSHAERNRVQVKVGAVVKRGPDLNSRGEAESVLVLPANCSSQIHPAPESLAGDSVVGV